MLRVRGRCVDTCMYVHVRCTPPADSVVVDQKSFEMCFGWPWQISLWESRPTPTRMTPHLYWMRPPNPGRHLPQPDRRRDEWKGEAPSPMKKARVASVALTFWDAADEISCWDDRSEKVVRGKLRSREINAEKEVGQTRWGEGKRGSVERRGEAGGWGGLSGYTGLLNWCIERLQEGYFDTTKHSSPLCWSCRGPRRIHPPVSVR